MGAFVFLYFFLYLASLFVQEWLDARKAIVESQGGNIEGFYAANSVAIMRVVGGIVAIATLVFVTIETFRRDRT